MNTQQNQTVTRQFETNHKLWTFKKQTKTWLTTKTHKPKKTLTEQETRTKNIHTQIIQIIGREPTYFAFYKGGFHDTLKPECPRCQSKNIVFLEGAYCIKCGDYGCRTCGTTWQIHNCKYKGVHP